MKVEGLIRIKNNLSAFI